MQRPPLVPPGAELSPNERTRYARHLLLPEVGGDGQRRLAAARVLVIGAGGLGSPALLYLAAAGVGTIGVVDDDSVDLTNLQRQVVHRVADIGTSKVASAARAVVALNPGVTVREHPHRLDADNVLEVLADYDLVIDGADNFPTRYLVGDACARLGMPHVWGSVFRFEGQASVWSAGEGPCYACVFPEPPADGAVPSCAVGGVFGAVCAAIGSVLATEAIKLVTGIGEPLIGRLLLHDALAQQWSEIAVRPNPVCRVCGSAADPTVPIGLAASSPAAAVGAIPEVSASSLADAIASGPVIVVDVREAGEREVARIPGARWIPLDVVRSGDHEALPTDEPVYVHCKSGGRSAEAVRLLRAAGVDARNVTGGILAWSRDVDPEVPTY